MFFGSGAYLEFLSQKTLCEKPGLLLEGHEKDVLRLWGLSGGRDAKQHCAKAWEYH